MARFYGSQCSIGCMISIGSSIFWTFSLRSLSATFSMTCTRSCLALEQHCLSTLGRQSIAEPWTVPKIISFCGQVCIVVFLHRRMSQMEAESSKAIFFRQSLNFFPAEDGSVKWKKKILHFKRKRRIINHFVQWDEVSAICFFKIQIIGRGESVSNLEWNSYLQLKQFQFIVIVITWAVLGGIV